MKRYKVTVEREVIIYAATSAVVSFERRNVQRRTKACGASDQSDARRTFEADRERRTDADHRQGACAGDTLMYHDDPKVGQRWREKATGRVVVILRDEHCGVGPLWSYEDTGEQYYCCIEDFVIWDRFEPLEAS